MTRPGKKSSKEKTGSSAIADRSYRAATEPAATILAAARTSAEEAEKAIRSLDGDPRRPLALLNVAQKALSVVPAEALRMLELSETIFAEALSLSEQGGTTPTSRELVQAESLLLKSGAHLQLGHYSKARLQAEEARQLFDEGGDVGLGRAFCDYYSGQGAFFTRDFSAGERMLKRASRTFAEFGQDHLVTRLVGMLGTLFLVRGEFLRALRYLDHAVGLIDGKREPHVLTVALMNRGATLSWLGRYDEARISYARAIAIARRLALKSHLQIIRNGLAQTDFQRGDYKRALAAFSGLARDAEDAGFDVDLVYARLYIAECWGRLGFEERMVGEIDSLRQDTKTHRFAASSAMSELFACLDTAAIDADLVGHVRQYLEDTENGIQRPYRNLRLIG